MKRLLWVLLGAIVVWVFTRRRMDNLYGEVSRLREVERNCDDHRQEKSSPTEDDVQGFEQRMASASVDKQWRMAMLDALSRDESDESLGELAIDEDDS